MDGGWERPLRRASLAVTAALAAGTAAAAAAVVWRRSKAAFGEDEEEEVEEAMQRPEVRALPRGLLEVQSPSAAAPDSAEEEGISWEEVARHDRMDDAWLVLSGEVYDVSPFLEDHPGGKVLLLAFAGRDATEPFETVGHSALALRELRSLHLGKVNRGPGGTTKAIRRQPLQRAVTLTGGHKAEGKSVQNDAPLWQVGNNGFMPMRDPVGIEALNGTAFEPFVSWCELLPMLGFTGMLREKLDGDTAMQELMLKAGEPSALQGLSDDQLERAFAVVGYIMVAYWRGGVLAYSSGVAGQQATAKKLDGGSCGIDDTKVVLPAFLAAPMLNLSRHLERPPMIDYASTVLYNWERINKNGPVTMSNIRCVTRLTGLIDEEWFFKTHVIIESESSHAIAAVLQAARAEDDAELLDHLTALEEALFRVVRACLPIMYERDDQGTPRCSENVFYQILRPLIKTGPLVFEGDSSPAPRVLAGPSGAMSSLMPAIDAACGIEMTSGKLKEALTKFEVSMPKAHRDFLAELRTTTTIRQRILLSRPVAGQSDEHHESLVRCFNRVISRVLDWRWQHWQYVRNFVMKPGNISHAVGSGGTTFDFLQQHITDTEKARIREKTDLFHLNSQTSELPPVHLPLLSGGQATGFMREFWSVDNERGLLSREPLCPPKSSSFAATLQAPMMAAFEALWNLAERMPSLCVANGPFYQTVEAAGPRLSALQDDRAVAGLSEAAREHLMTVLCHIAAGCMGSSNHKRPPRCVDKPLQVVARSVGRPAHLDFTELVLCNWSVSTKGPPERRPEGEAEQAGGAGEGPATVRHHVMLRFLAMPDEEWYRTIHVVMLSEARDVVAAIRMSHVAMRDQNDMAAVSSMVKVGAWCNRFCDYFDHHFDNKDSRTESVLIRRLEPYVTRGGLHDLSIEETACWIYLAGSAVIFPAMFAFFGIDMCPPIETESPDVAMMWETLSRMIKELRIFMPVPHREFLELLERPGVSIRQYCFRRFGAKSVSVEVLHDLEAGYNDALNALLRLLSRRLHLVCRFYPQLSGSFGGLVTDLEAVVQHSRLQLLKMRQRVYRTLQS